MNIIQLLREPYKGADPANLIMMYIAIAVFIAGIIRWIYKKRLTAHPLRIKEAYEDYETFKTDDERTFSPLFEPIRIFCINNKLMKEKMVLHFRARRPIRFTRINLRFIDNVPEEMLTIEKVIFPQTHYNFKIDFKSDRKGGFDGYFDPPTDIPKETILFFEIYPRVNVATKLRCKISLENASSGEERRTFTRKAVIITNKVI